MEIYSNFQWYHKHLSIQIHKNKKEVKLNYNQHFYQGIKYKQLHHQQQQIIFCKQYCFEIRQNYLQLFLTLKIEAYRIKMQGKLYHCTCLLVASSFFSYHSLKIQTYPSMMWELNSQQNSISSTILTLDKKYQQHLYYHNIQAYRNKKERREGMLAPQLQVLASRHLEHAVKQLTHLKLQNLDYNCNYFLRKPRKAATVQSFFMKASSVYRYRKSKKISPKKTMIKQKKQITNSVLNLKNYHLKTHLLARQQDMIAILSHTGLESKTNYNFRIYQQRHI